MISVFTCSTICCLARREFRTLMPAAVRPTVSAPRPGKPRHTTTPSSTERFRSPNSARSSHARPSGSDHTMLRIYIYGFGRFHHPDRQLLRADLGTCACAVSSPISAAAALYGILRQPRMRGRCRHSGRLLLERTMMKALVPVPGEADGQR